MINIGREARKHLGQLSKADLHIHSNFSDGKPSIEEILDYVEKETDLAVIAITDHDTIEGALLARELLAKKKHRFEVVVGEEVSSLEGHILGLYLKKAIKPGLPAHQVISEIHSQGGIAIAAHPLYTTRMNHREMASPIVNGVGSKELLKDKEGFDALETVNATPLMGDENLRAKYLNRLLLFRAETGSSDAHILDAIGKGFTLFEGKTAADLKKAILDFQTQSMNERWNILGVLKYGFYFLPHGLRTTARTIVFGPSRKEPSFIKFPRNGTLKKEVGSDESV